MMWVRRPPAVVSRDEVEAEKAVMRAVDTRPIKKIAEAKARKRRRLQVTLCDPGHELRPLISLKHYILDPELQKLYHLRPWAWFGPHH